MLLLQRRMVLLVFQCLINAFGTTEYIKLIGFPTKATERSMYIKLLHNTLGKVIHFYYTNV
jgi:hypothetical protein